MTIRELAKLIDVSPSAISIVLNGRDGVSDETRDKILNAIDYYNYSPNRKKVSKNKSVLLMKYYKSGFLVEENQGFIATIIDSIEQQLRKEHIGMTLKVAKGDLSINLDEINYADYCGMVIIATEIPSENYGMLENIPIPFVVVDNTVPHFPYSSVCMNNHENVYMALNFLKSCGHREIGYIGSLINVENFNSRYKAFKQISIELGMEYKVAHTYRVTPTLIGAYDDFIKILGNDLENMPGSFFSENDTIALGIIKAFKEKGYKIPEDISVIGFDNIPYASISSPSLTTVHVQREIIGRQTVNQLLQIIKDNNNRFIKTEVIGELIIRDSVKVLKN